MSGAGGVGGPSPDEMRPVTSLFADVVGSTALGERLGPDEVKALVGECVTRMSRAVEEFGGTIQAYMGDGICAYFGVPQAHEDDPQRATKAALRIISVVSEYAEDIEAAWGITGFNVRVGINTGQTAVGSVGAAAPQTVALGDSTNVAARLQSAASPGTIVVGEATAKHLGQRFVLESAGELTVKGRTEPVPAFRVVGAAPASEVVPAGPLVGREAEMAQLERVVDDLLAGRGQALLLVGDTGLGKTRLLAELRIRLGDRVTWLEGACVSYEGQPAGGALVDCLRQWLGVAEGDAEVAVRTRLRAKIGALIGSDHADDLLPALSRMLALKLDPETDEILSHMPPDEAAASLWRAYAGWTEALARERPVVLAVEDVHWAVPATRALLEALLEVTERAPLLLVTTLRRGAGTEGWGYRLRVQSDYSHRATEVALRPLRDDAVEQLLSLLMPIGLEDDARADIVRRAEGNPLYVEQLLRAMLDAAGANRQRTWTLSLSAADLPPELESLLAARVDRLPAEARRLAQLAAVIGRTFPVRVLEHIAGVDAVHANLPLLLRAEIVREVRRYPEFECAFVHGLVQESALSTLTPGRQRELYGDVGRAYEALFPDAVEDRLEQLAFLFYRSDEHPKALDYLERAAEQAATLGLADQAAGLLRRAIKAAGRASDSVAQGRIERRLQELGTG
jgi:class 3 adenylate cyclase